jgi:hypothetical protein
MDSRRVHMPASLAKHAHTAGSRLKQEKEYSDISVGIHSLPMKPEGKNAIFRIAIRSTEDQDTWIVEGRLAGVVVDELTASWKRAISEEPRRKRVVDLVGVTCVDEEGEQALLQMTIDNARFVVRGVYMKSLIESLSKHCTRGA